MTETTALGGPTRSADEPARTSPPRLGRAARQWLLVGHIVCSVSLLGDSAGYLAVAIRTSKIDDPALLNDSLKVLNMFSLVFGIPLSFGALLTGIGLGLGSRWGVFRYPWVTIKLGLIVTVLLVGAFVIAPASSQMADGGADATDTLIAGASYDVVALLVATILSVLKPGRAYRGPRSSS